MMMYANFRTYGIPVPPKLNINFLRSNGIYQKY